MRWFRKTIGLIVPALFTGIIGASCSNHNEPTVPHTYTGQNEPDISGQDQMPGEYIITISPSGDEEQIRKLFEDYRIKDIKDLGRRRFLIKLEHDPGLDKIKRMSLESTFVKQVQPNFIYRPETQLENH
jgi:hypothetical protein